LIGIFDSEVEIQQIIEFAFVKFRHEVDQEKKAVQQKKSGVNSVSGSESSSGENEDSDYSDGSSMFEKKLHILHIPHIILWKSLNQLSKINPEQDRVGYEEKQREVEFVL
jgi:hypothetical protein